MIVIKAKDYNELSKKAAMIVLNEILLDPSITLGFATGSTPIGLYKELIKAHKELNTDFSKTTTFNLDEYYPIKKTDKQSYFYFMNQNLFNHLNIDKNNINFLDSETKNPKTECDSFEKKIKDKLINLQILGIGANGHIAFNEPSSSFDSKTRVVDLTTKTMEDNSRLFKTINDVPKKALTVGISTIMSAKKIILLATGKNKAEAVKWMIEGPVDEKCPASILQRHPDVVVIVDEDASSLLQKEAMPDEMRGFKIITDNNIPRNKSIIAISPHPDDASIGPGGTLALFAEKNDVHVFVMTTGHRAFIAETKPEQRMQIREDEVIEESRILKTTPHLLRLDFYDKGEKTIEKDSKKILEKFLLLKPDIVMIPQKNDVHPTHQMARKATLKALDKYNKPVEVWNYESPWALFDYGFFNTIVPIPEKFIQRKISAIKSQKSQISRTRYDVAAESLAKLRGALIPEQGLFGFGKKSMKISPYIEIFFIEKKHLHRK